MNQPVLSISVAAYNAASYLANSLCLFGDIRLKDKVEVIIVNDGSNDNTLIVANSFKEKYPDRFVVIDKENGGWGSTINASLKIAKGKYYRLMDADDWYDIDELCKLIRFLESSDMDLIYTSYDEVHVDEDSLTISKKIPDDLIGVNISFNEDCDVERLLDLNWAMHSLVFKTCSIRNRYTITEKAFYTDVEYVVKSISNIKNMCFIDNCVYKYAIGIEGQSVSLDGINKHYHEHINVSMNLMRFYSGLICVDSIKKIIKNRIDSMIRTQYFYFYILPYSNQVANEFKDYDDFICKNYPEFRIGGKKLWLYRHFGNSVFRFLLRK